MSVNKKIIETEAAVPREKFNIVLYTGNGGTQSITGVGFQPDFVWIKGRTFTVIHGAYDSTRGATKYITPTLNIAEGTYSTVLNAFGTDGFTVGSNGGVNASGEDFVAWCWRANGGSTSNNNVGLVTSVVQTNSAAGFSIVKYPGSGGHMNVGHGLSIAPELMIIKNLSQADDWAVYHSALGATKSLKLNDTGAALTDSNGISGIFGGTSPNSSVFRVGADHRTGANGENYIAYCFYSVAGFSKIGTYTGTGSAGNAQTIGFQPDFIILKRYNLTDNWVIIDSVRGEDEYLLADTDGNEQSLDILDITSTGWTFKGGSMNNSSDSFIYIAFKIS